MAICVWSRRGFIAMAMWLSACGGGGVDVIPKVVLPKDYGSLTVTGPGVGNSGGRYVPLLLTLAGAGGPVCNATCNSFVTVSWIDSAGKSLEVGLGSVGLPAPGASPGTQVNQVTVAYGDSVSFSGACGVAGEPSCTAQPLGVTVDTARRTVSFVNTPLAADSGNGGGVVLNGTLSY